MKNAYEVLVGNIGTVYAGNNKSKANKVFNTYVRDSKKGYGRAAGEEVTLFKDGDIAKEYIPDNWFPVSDITKLLKSLKKEIGDEYRCSDDPDDNIPGMIVTISTDDGSDWAYQTGDPSFEGACYDHQHWATIHLYRRSNCKQLAEDAVKELKDLVAEASR